MWMDSTEEEKETAPPQSASAKSETSIETGTPLSREEKEKETAPNPIHPKALQGLLEIQARQSSFYASPPAANVEMEAWLLQAWRDEEYNQHFHRLLLGSLKTDAHGRASLAIVIEPMEGMEEPIGGHIFLSTTTPGWQDPREAGFFPFLKIHGKGYDKTQADIILSQGASLRVIVEGTHAGWSATGEDGWAFLRDADTEEILARHPIRQHAALENRAYGAVFALLRKGNYQIVGQGEHGTGVASLLDFDPKDGNRTITLHAQPHLMIAGRFHHPEGFREMGTRVIAVRSEDAETEVPEPWIVGTPRSPSHHAEARIQKDGSFHISGLAAGSYRLAYARAAFEHHVLNDSEDIAHFLRRRTTVWLNMPPVEAGADGLELDLPYAFLEVEVVNEKGDSWDPAARGGPVAWASHAPRFPDGPYQYSHPLDAKANIKRIPILAGVPHWLGVRAWKYERVLEEIAPLNSGEVKAFRIQMKPEQFGRLAWTKPEYDYSVKAYRLKPDGSPGAKEREYANATNYTLPAGKYLVQIQGENYYSFGHGRVGPDRTHWGRQEIMVEISPGETTWLDFQLPIAGSLKLQISALGQPDYKAYPVDAFPPISDLAFDRRYLHGNRADLVIRNKQDGQLFALTHQAYIGGSSPETLLTFEPGEDYVPLAVFAAGAYELEVRIPGFPRQLLDLEITGRQQTFVEITLQGKE